MSCQGGIKSNLHMATTLYVSLRQYQVPQPCNHIKHVATPVIKNIGVVKGFICPTKLQDNGAHTHATTKSNVGKRNPTVLMAYNKPWACMFPHGRKLNNSKVRQRRHGFDNLQNTHKVRHMQGRTTYNTHHAQVHVSCTQ
jgi:hypothetical protein